MKKLFESLGRFVSNVRHQPKLTLQAMREMPPERFAEYVRKYLHQASRNGRYSPTTTSTEHNAFIRRPKTTWLSNIHLQFLCSELGLRRSAFLFHDNHCEFITHVGQDFIRSYDSLTGKINTHRRADLESEINAEPLQVSVFITPDLEQDRLFRHSKLLRQKVEIVEKPPVYPVVQYLADSEYKHNESFVDRLGTIQRDAHNCIPLSMYAAIHAMQNE